MSNSNLRGHNKLAPKKLIKSNLINPLVPDAHYSEHQDKPFSLQIQRLEVDLKLNCGFSFFAPLELMG